MIIDHSDYTTVTKSSVSISYYDLLDLFDRKFYYIVSGNYTNLSTAAPNSGNGLAAYAINLNYGSYSTISFLDVSSFNYNRQH